LHDQPNPLLERKVLLGALGWDWPDWEGGFYPLDMPPEWRLTFYNTQFQCVFLPAAQWRGATGEALAQWADDTHDRFVFLLEGEDETPVPQPLREKAMCISEKDERITWFDGQTDLRWMAEGLKKQVDGPRILLSRDGDLSQLERVRTLLGLLGFMT
jgi:hypothetical protein